MHTCACMHVYMYEYIHIYIYIYIYMRFSFFIKYDVPGIFMPCVCVMHCRRRFLKEKMTFLVFVCPVCAFL